MKFSHSLQFNAVPEWSSKYISYTTLKKLIYNLQRESLRHQNEDLESAHLINSEASSNRDPVVVFTTALDSELHKIDVFFRKQEEFIYKNIDDLVADIDAFENEMESSDFGNSAFQRFGLRRFRTSDDGSSGLGRARSKSAASLYEDPIPNTTDPETEFTQDENEDGEDAIGEEDYDEYLKSPNFSAWTTNFDGTSLPPQLALLSESRVLLRKKVIALYTTLCELKSFIELNQTGFKKATKKFDKSLNANLKNEYLPKLPQTYIFKESTMKTVDEKIESLIKLYALICNQEDLNIAKTELSIHLRDHVVWERNTVWRDMIGLERKTQAANSMGAENSNNNEEAALGLSSFNISFRNPTIVKLAIIVGITVILLNISFFDDVPQKNCFALLVCASLLWATETIPLFVTSLLIPLLIVNFGVLKYPDGSPMDTLDSSKFILSTMWSSVILLLLGGFTLAASLTKYNIAKLISTWVLSKAGTNPSVVLLTIMSIALFASMWVSNVAAPVLCFSLIHPLLRTLPKDSKFINALILGIALASNVGGMASPIASPQNMIAIGAMDPQPSWGQWFVIALPVCVLSLVGIWLFLLMTFKCNSQNTQLVPIRTMDDKFTGIQWYIVIVSISTILLWCFASKLEGVFGEMGIIALIPIILFFGTGLLTTEDFNNYPWNIVVLAMGGTALGKAVASSGLLATIAVTIEKEVEGLSLFGVTLTFGLLILTMATFVSHTVAALIVIPLVAEIGNKMSDPHPRMLIMASALLCSAAMGLPTSGFPNVTAICMTDEFGKPYLTVNTFITRGVPSSFIAYIIIVSVGYGIMNMINF
ncbi:SPX-domain-containing protein [Metschnikowia bicuspidata var. bicuspidata NRRL YB-4993]|uniref:SPX-domain-containing protein n=1 Tax=Metschnikowia bicuspidata var. bicuspidata NRRL YB-4993 TaxID=869754 RepID=A0A1A0H6I2_9ASCO|nr:SPX-domain-containing protein [Metschnikowia bicuspidata var. bicuspidata NRRL YB-4993]OBA19570.1 SPX-domain-containing protein [Metschnikowia bicuspidata var. bicuspidata NRRL YB-4993]